jgi:hypothetical protein
MNKKITIAAVMIIFFSIIFSSVALSSEIKKDEKSTGLDITTSFTSHPMMQIDFDKDATGKDIIPRSELHKIPLEVYYQITGIFSKWHALIFKDRMIEVKLSIIGKPEWCTAYLDITDLLFGLKTNWSVPQNATLLVGVNEKAPASYMGKITITATSSSINGLIFTKVSEGNITVDIPFLVGYLPIIAYELETTYIEIPPLNVTRIPIKITNFGNGRTSISVEVKNLSDKCTVNYTEIIILDSPVSGEENEGIVEIAIEPQKEFSMESLVVSLTPSYTERPDLKGKATILQITLKNDGSLKEEFKIDTTLLIITIVAIIFIIIITFILKRKK